MRSALGPDELYTMNKDAYMPMAQLKKAKEIVMASGRPVTNDTSHITMHDSASFAKVASRKT